MHESLYLWRGGIALIGDVELRMRLGQPLLSRFILRLVGSDLPHDRAEVLKCLILLSFGLRSAFLLHFHETSALAFWF